jgi:hypothetical protein
MSARRPTLLQTEHQFRESMGRVIEGQDHGLADPRPRFDPKQAQEFRAETVQGRQIEAFRQALEAHGFRFFSDHEMARMGLAPTGEGLWRHPSRVYQMAFTPGEILAGFPEGPEAFDRWVRAHKAGKDLQRQREKGLVSAATAAEAKIVIARG